MPTCARCRLAIAGRLPTSAVLLMAALSAQLPVAVAHGQTGAPGASDEADEAGEAGGPGEATPAATPAPVPPQHPATPNVEQPEHATRPPPPADAEGDGNASAGPSTPEPPPSYLLPPPAVGARYPGMDDLRSGSPFEGDDGELRLPIRISTRLRVLSTDLEALSSEGGSSTANGVLSMVTGGLILALGALTEDESFSTFLYVFGTATILRGGVDMIVTPDPSEPALQYAHMPMRDIGEVRRRLDYGERGLNSLADGFRLARILDGTLSLAAGTLTIPLVLAPKDFKFEHTFDVFVVIGAGISILSGVVSLLTKSEAERRNAAYRKLRRKLRRPPPKQSSGDVAIRVVPSPNGAIVQLRGQF